MNSSGNNYGPLRTLWWRAPLWRFSFLVAVLLSLSFILFPPNDLLVAQKPDSTNTDHASYVSSPVATVAQTIPPAFKPLPEQVPSTTQTSPTVASLSLAGVSTAKPDASGLDTALMGRSYSGSISVNGYKIPLPAGKWVMLANSTVTIPTASGMAYFLGRIENKRLIGAIRVFAIKSKEQPGAGFQAIAGCQEGEPNNIYLSIEAVTPYDHEACWLMHNFYTPPWQQWADKAVKISSLDRAAAGDLAAKGVTYAQDFVAVRFSRAEKWGLLEVAYMFDPESEGLSARNAASFRDSDWYAGNIAHFPEKLAYISKLKEWGNNFWPQFKKAFDAEAPAAMTVVAPQSSIQRPDGNVNSTVSKTFPLDIKLGDDVARVKAVLQTDLDPQLMPRPASLPPNMPDINAGKSVLHLTTRGIWVFFDQMGKVYTIRLDAPFMGEVKGLRLNDDVSKLTSLLGRPLVSPYPAFGRMLAYKYVLNDLSYVIYDVAEGRIQYILVTS